MKDSPKQIIEDVQNAAEALMICSHDEDVKLQAVVDGGISRIQKLIDSAVENALKKVSKK